MRDTTSSLSSQIMKSFFTLYFALVGLMPLYAQQTDGARERRFDDGFVRADTTTLDSLTLHTKAADVVLPLITPDLSPFLSKSPYDFGGYGLGGFGGLDSGWRLHEGFNASFSLSLSTGLGHGALRGIGFGQTAAFAYALPVTPHLTLAAGLYARNLDWGALHLTDVGFAALANYQITERINVFAYASTSFLPRTDFEFRRPRVPYFLAEPRSRIGGGAEFKLGENGMIGISVERME